jgi:hypothetical protein
MHLFGGSGDQFHFHWLPPPWGHLTHALLGSSNLFKIAHRSGQAHSLEPFSPRRQTWWQVVRDEVRRRGIHTFAAQPRVFRFEGEQYYAEVRQ